MLLPESKSDLVKIINLPVDIRITKKDKSVGSILYFIFLLVFYFGNIYSLNICLPVCLHPAQLIKSAIAIASCLYTKDALLTVH